MSQYFIFFIIFFLFISLFVQASNQLTSPLASPTQSPTPSPSGSVSSVCPGLGPLPLISQFPRPGGPAQGKLTRRVKVQMHTQISCAQIQQYQIPAINMFTHSYHDPNYKNLYQVVVIFVMISY